MTILCEYSTSWEVLGPTLRTCSKERRPSFKVVCYCNACRTFFFSLSPSTSASGIPGNHPDVEEGQHRHHAQRHHPEHLVPGKRIREGKLPNGTCAVFSVIKTCTRLHYKKKDIPRLRECCRQVEAELVSNSR